MIRVVAFGGGHGLGATLRALRRLRSDLELDVTAVVTVGDDGGSSGRLRAQRGGLPPGDLRQALVALTDVTDPVAQLGADLFQFRFDGAGELAGHAVGNLVLCALMERAGDPVVALDHARALLNAVGRVLPMTRTPLSIEARVRGADPDRPTQTEVVWGQHAVAGSAGVVEDVCIIPAKPQACAEAVDAVAAADWLLFGPGSWFTSVIPHLLVPDLAAAVLDSPARRLVTLNLAVEQETVGLSLPDHLRALARYLPGLRVDVVLADTNAVTDPVGLTAAAESLRAQVVLAPVAVTNGASRHDPGALAAALCDVLTTR